MLCLFMSIDLVLTKHTVVAIKYAPLPKKYLPAIAKIGSVK